VVAQVTSVEQVQGGAMTKKANFKAMAENSACSS
jgi:hypothetical protein